MTGIMLGAGCARTPVIYIGRLTGTDFVHFLCEAHEGSFEVLILLILLLDLFYLFFHCL